MQGFHVLPFNLSRVLERKSGENGAYHSEYVNQVRSDMKLLLDKRIAELVLGGTLTAIVGAKMKVENLNLTRLHTESYRKLLRTEAVT